MAWTALHDHHLISKPPIPAVATAITSSSPTSCFYCCPPRSHDPAATTGCPSPPRPWALTANPRQPSTASPCQRAQSPRRQPPRAGSAPTTAHRNTGSAHGLPPAAPTWPPPLSRRTCRSRRLLTRLPIQGSPLSSVSLPQPPGNSARLEARGWAPRLRGWVLRGLAWERGMGAWDQAACSQGQGGRAKAVEPC